MALFRYDQTSGKLVPITSEGSVGIPVGAVMAFAQGTSHKNWLLCDGRDTTGTEEELQTHYPALYTYLGNSNILPDYRECVLVGVGTNDTDTIAEHDVYTLGEFKDDQLQAHKHNINGVQAGLSSSGYPVLTRDPYNINTQTGGVDNTTARTGTTTHGKQKGVAFYIKATSAGIEVDKDLYATKGYIRDQNVLSDYEDITLPSTAATAITMQYDGILCVNFNGTSGAKAVYVNGKSIISGTTAGYGVGLTLHFNKGDTVYATLSTTSSVAYYKLRDYTGR